MDTTYLQLRTHTPLHDLKLSSLPEQSECQFIEYEFIERDFAAKQGGDSRAASNR